MKTLNIRKERITFIISVIVILICIVVYYSILPFSSVGKWVEWSSDGTGQELSADLLEDMGMEDVESIDEFHEEIEKSYSYDDLMFTLASISMLFTLVLYLTCIVMIIKISTVDIMSMRGQNIEESALTKARIGAGIFFFMIMPWSVWQLGTDYYLIFNFLMILTWVGLSLYFFHWKNSQRHTLLSDILLFRDNFINGLLSLILITGISSIIGSYFLLWYEGEWAEEYYAEEGITHLFTDFEKMLLCIQILGIIFIISAVLCYFVMKWKKRNHGSI